MDCKNCENEIMDEVLNVTQESCAEQEAVASPEAVEHVEPAKVVNPRMRGFGRSLTAVILSTIGLSIAAFMCLYGLYSFIDVEMLYVCTSNVALFVIPTLALTAFAIVFGIKSIFTFVRSDGKKPIATVVLGSCALFFALLALLLTSITVLALFAALFIVALR